MPPLVIAHRTCPHHAPENSIAGVRRAAELGADGVEVDVQRTLDGVPILMHDRLLRRTTGVPLSARVLPYAIVRRLRLAGGDQRVPTLAEALDALPSGLAIAIEIKHAAATAPALAEVRRRGLESRTLLWSEHAAAVRHAVAHHPELETALLRDYRWRPGLRRFLDEATRLRAGAISAHWRAIAPDFLERAHARGLRVYSYSKDLRFTLAHVRAGIDGAITDWPGELRAALQSGEAAV